MSKRTPRNKTRAKSRMNEKKVKWSNSMRPLPSGKVVARCSLCSGLAKTDGKGTPVTIKHASNCPEHPLNRRNESS